MSGCDGVQRRARSHSRGLQERSSRFRCALGLPSGVRLAGVAALLAVSCTTPTPTQSPTSTARPSPSVGTNCSAFAPDPSDEFFTPTDVSYVDPAPLDWPTGSPADVGLDEALLNAAADNVALSADVRSLLVVRHGKLVFERYFNGSDAGEANTIASASKSILSVATGIAIDEGLFQLDTRIDEFLPADLVGAHGDLTIENLLTMSGGLAMSEDPLYVADVGPSDLPGEPSFVRAVLSRESVAPAGSKFAYSTGLTQVLAAVLTEATGQSLCAYVADRLLDPLGIDVEKWWVEPDGYFAGGHSVFITPREMARFGQLVLQHGMWDGEQLVPAAWLDRSLAERWDLGCRRVLDSHQGYGFLWWLYDVHGYQVWNASGYGGQEVWIAPDLDLLIVATHDASRVGQPDHHEVAPGAVARAAILGTTDAPRHPGARHSSCGHTRCGQTVAADPTSPTGPPAACRLPGRATASASPSSSIGAISTPRSTRSRRTGRTSLASRATSPWTPCRHSRPIDLAWRSPEAARPRATYSLSASTAPTCSS